MAAPASSAAAGPAAGVAAAGSEGGGLGVTEAESDGIGEGEDITVIHISDPHWRKWYEEDIPIPPWREWNFVHDIPRGNILIVSGDIGDLNTEQEFRDMLTELNDLFGHLPHEIKIYIAGNHEVLVEQKGKQAVRELLTNGIYLEDEEFQYKGLRIYGTPWTDTPKAFTKPLEQLPEVWSKIPTGLDILVTHMPPKEVLDYAFKKQAFEHSGCPDLYQRVVHELHPRYHLFGHVHDQPGVESREEVPGHKVIFCNASLALAAPDQGSPLKGHVARPIRFRLKARRAEPAAPAPAAPAPAVAAPDPPAAPARQGTAGGWTYRADRHFVHNQTKYHLDLDMGDMSEGTRVIAYDERPKENQQWKFVNMRDASGYSFLISDISPGLAVSAEGDGTLKNVARQPGQAQRWRFDPATGVLSNESGLRLEAVQHENLYNRLQLQGP